MNNEEKEILIAEIDRIKLDYKFDSKLIFDSYSDYYLIDIDALDVEISDELKGILYEVRNKFNSEFPNSILLINWIGKDFKFEGDVIYNTNQFGFQGFNFSKLISNYSKRILEIPTLIYQSQLEMNKAIIEFPAKLLDVYIKEFETNLNINNIINNHNEMLDSIFKNLENLDLNRKPRLNIYKSVKVKDNEVEETTVSILDVTNENDYSMSA